MKIFTESELNELQNEPDFKKQIERLIILKCDVSFHRPMGRVNQHMDAGILCVLMPYFKLGAGITQEAFGETVELALKAAVEYLITALKDPINTDDWDDSGDNSNE